MTEKISERLSSNENEPTPLDVEEARADAGAQVTPAQGRLMLMVVGFTAIVVALSQSLLVPVLPLLPETLHTSTATAEWLLTSTLLVAGVAVPVVGRLGDMFGKRRMLLVSVAALAVGSLVTALSSDVTVLIIGRSIQGLAMGSIALGISLLASLLPREQVGSGIAIVSSSLGVGSALGLPLAGLIGEHADFHVLFWMMLGGCVIALAGLWFLVPEAPSRSGGRLDPFGTVILAAALVALLLPLAETSSWGWGSVKVIGLLALSVVLFVVLTVLELRLHHPLVDFRTLRRRPLVFTNLASLLFGFALFASLLGTASFVQAPKASGYGFGASMVVGGLCLLPSGLAMLFLAPVSARISAARGPAATLILGAVVVAAGWALRIVLTGSLWQVIVGTTIVGLGTGLGYAAMPSLINMHTPVSEISAANGLNTLFRSIGSSLASAVGGSVLAATTIALGPAVLPSLSAYRVLFALCAGAAVLAAIAALFIPREPSH
jgi:MFS family permease